MLQLLPSHSVLGLEKKRRKVYLYFLGGWKEEEWLRYGGKVYDEFQIPVHLKLLIK